MKDFGFQELFCEILTGLALMCVLLPIGVIAGEISPDQVVENLAKLKSPGTLTLVMVAAYFLGVVFDAIGLALGEMKLDALASSREPSEADRKAFWASVPAQVLDYRDRQWAFYACYRNLFILAPFAGLLWAGIAICASRPLLAISILAMVVALEFCLFRVMSTLLGLYYLITGSYVGTSTPSQVAVTLVDERAKGS